MKRLRALIIAAVCLVAACTTSGGGVQSASRAADSSAPAASAPSRSRLAVEGTAPTTTSAPHVVQPRASRSRVARPSGAPPTAPSRPAARQPQGGIESAICDGFGAACQSAIRVARCESGLNPHATNGSHRGLFQVSTRWHAARVQRMGYTLDQLWEVGPNIAVARAIFAESGWGPWSCKP